MATHKPVGRDVLDAPFCTSSHHGSRVVEDADPYKYTNLRASQWERTYRRGG